MEMARGRRSDQQNLFSDTAEPWVVVPIFNEARVLPSVLPPLLQCYSRVILIDDGSTDDTFDVVSRYPVHLLRHPLNLGQGAAIRLGVQYALEQGAEIIVTMDADGQMDPAEIEKLIRPLRMNQADIVIGSRFGPNDSKPAKTPLLRGWILRLGARFLNFFWNLNLTDAQNGFRAMTGTAARKISISRNRMAHALEILYQINKNHLKMAEVPVTISYTAYSLKKGQRLNNSFNILWESLLSLPLESR